MGLEKLSMAAIVASGIVAVLSLYHLMPRMEPTNSSLCGTPGKLASADMIPSGERPKARAATAAARIFFF